MTTARLQGGNWRPLGELNARFLAFTVAGSTLLRRSLARNSAASMGEYQTRFPASLRPADSLGATGDRPHLGPPNGGRLQQASANPADRRLQ